MTITKTNRDTYQITLSATDLMALSALLSVLRTGFINWLQRKGKRTQEQQWLFVQEADKILNSFARAQEA